MRSPVQFKRFVLQCALLLAVVPALRHSAAGDAPPTRVAVCEAIPVQGKDYGLAGRAISDHLRQRGMECDFLEHSELRDGGRLLREPRYDLVIFPHCEVFSAPLLERLPEYLKAGGRMLLIGGRPFEQQAVWSDEEGRWITADQFEEMRRRIAPEKVFARFTDEEMRAWNRASGSPENPTKFSTEPSKVEGTGPALRVDVANFENWDIVSHVYETSPLADDPRLLTCLRACGSKDLPQLSVEWEESDGSRWIAVVDLTPEWRRHALPVDRFKFWQDSRSRRRGGPGDAFKPANARRLAFGISDSHTNKVPKRVNHTYWIADIGWAIDTTPRLIDKPPTLEILSPWYKTYETKNVVKLRSVPSMPYGMREDYPAPPAIISPVARTRGKGFEDNRPFRWIPLVEAVGKNGGIRGAPVSVLINGAGAYERSAWGYVGIADAKYAREQKNALLNWTTRAAEILAGGVWLFQAGTEEAMYFEGEPWQLKMEILNRSPRPADVGGVLGVRNSKSSGPFGGGRSGNSFSGIVAPMGRRVFENLFGTLDNPPRKDFGPEPEMTMLQLDTRLSAEGPQWLNPMGGPGGAIVRMEGISQPVRILDRNRKPDPRRLVRVEGGDFVVDGKPWVPFGINFWPRDVTGIEDFNYWNNWLSPGFYDPERTRRDLERVREFGMNVVCVQYHDEGQARSLIDFLEQCRKLDLRAFIYMPGGFPLGPNPRKLQSMIRAAQLSETDAVFAYDVAWEPRVGLEQQRRAHDAAWRYWIDERYGGIENAEKDWGIAAPRDENGRVSGPSQKQLLNDGPHRVMVAAYRRFIDDLISLGYGRVARAIREVDPHHLIGVRSGWGGTGSAWGDAQMPFDLASGAAHLDFISPEGYGHGPEWATVQNAGLTTLYGRLVGGGKPVWWAEYGMSVHPQPDEKALARQGEMYANFARMFVESRANGGTGWWFPGGFRVGENSDYGIFNPDGTPRPAALANREWSERVAAIRAPAGKADVTITIDRDLHPRGYSQIRARHEKEYLDAVDAGKSVALRTEGTGTNSANTPLVAVGNRPCNGHNPPKYLNAEFERFWIKIGDADWREIEMGEKVEVPRGAHVLGHAHVANTAEAAWLPPTDPRAAKAGGVQLVSTRTSGLNVRASLAKEVPFLGNCAFDEFVITERADRSLTISFELEATNRARFGQQFPLHFELAK